jgi:hypothetical protein
MQREHVRRNYISTGRSSYAINHSLTHSIDGDNGSSNRQMSCVRVFPVGRFVVLGAGKLEMFVNERDWV